MPTHKCRVKCCRFKDSHVTRAHKCGTCGEFGHGQLECNNSAAITALSEHWNERLDSNHCDVALCPTPNTHTSAGHFCKDCNKRGGCNCALKKVCPTCKETSEIDPKLIFYTGGDCIICMEPTPMILFGKCAHVNVCLECALKLNS
jgi:hypothetical protein